MSDVYKIGVSIALANGVSPVLAIIGKDLLGLNTTVKQVEQNFNRWRMAAGGVAAIMTGSAMLSGVAKLVRDTKDLSHELVQIQKLGINPVQYGEVQRAAISLPHRMVGVTRKDALEAYGAAYSLAGHDDAIKLMEPLEKFAQVIANTTGRFDTSTKDLITMLRSADLIGRLSDPKTHDVALDRLTHFLDVGAKVMLATHGLVTAQTWLGLAQQGGPALMHMDDQGLMTMGMLAQAMGGPRAGTAMMSLFQQMAGGTMFTRTAEEMQRLGLLKAGDWHKDHGRVILSPTASDYLTKNLRTDPLNWIAKDVLPAMEKHGITEPDAQMRELYRFLQRQTTQRLTADMVRNLYQMVRERERIGGGLGLDKSIDIQNSQDQEQALHNMAQAWKDLEYAIAGPNGQNVVSFLNKITSALRTLTGVADAHPEAMKYALDVFVSLAGGLVVGGFVALAAAITGLGGTVGIIVALGASLSALTFLEKDKILAVLKIPFEVAQWASQLASGLEKAIVDGVKNAIKSAIAAIPGAFAALGAALMNAIKSIGGSLLPSFLGGGAKKQSYNASPPGGSSGARQHTALIMDGRKVGQLITRRIADRAVSPLEGSAYHDGTWHATPLDTSFA